SKCPPRNCRQDLPGATELLRFGNRRCGIAHKNALPRWSGRHAGWIEWAQDFNAADPGDAVVTPAWYEREQGLVRFGERSYDKGHADLVRPGLYTYRNILETAVDRSDCNRLFLIDRFDVFLTADGFLENSRAINGDDDPILILEPTNIAAAGQTIDVELVFAAGNTCSTSNPPRVPKGKPSM